MFESNSYHKEWRSREGRGNKFCVIICSPNNWLEKVQFENFRVRCLLQVLSIVHVQKYSNHNWCLLMRRNNPFSGGSRAGRTRPEWRLGSSSASPWGRFWKEVISWGGQSFVGVMTWEAAIRCQETQRQCGSHSCPAKSRVIEDENEPSSSGRYGFSASRGESTYLGNEVLLKLAKELQIEQVVRCQGFLTNNCLHRLHNTCQQKST